jgi:predicted RNA-binding protein YlqC (UPF0109 family)
MKELVETLVKALVKNPDAVSVTVVEKGSLEIYQVHVAPEDMGKVIGRKGRIANAIRTVVKAGALRENRRVAVDIIAMDEMQILVPVAVKSKLTEQLKATLLAEIEQNLKRVDHDMSQLDFEANGKLAEQAEINVQAVAPLRAQYEAQKVQMQQMKDKFLADKDHLERLTIGAELNRAPMNRLVTIHIGDDMNELLGGEILVEDGKIVEFRN